MEWKWVGGWGRKRPQHRVEVELISILHGLLLHMSELHFLLGVRTQGLGLHKTAVYCQAERTQIPLPQALTHQPTNKLTNSTGQNPFWQTDRSSSSQEINLFCETHNSQPLDYIPRQVNHVDTPTPSNPYHFDRRVIFSPTRRYPKRFLPSRLFD